MRAIGPVASFIAWSLLALTAAPPAPAAPRVFPTPGRYRSYAPALREADSLLWAQRTDEAMRRTAAIRAQAIARGERWPEMATLLLDAVANGMSGRGPAAEASGRAAQDLARRLGDRVYERRSLRWIAFGLGLEGRTAASDSAWRVLLRNSTAARDPAYMGYAHLGLGYSALVRGQSRTALAHYVPAERLLRRAGDLYLASTARVGLSRVYDRLGDVAGERRILLEILDDARHGGRGRSEADALNNLGALEYGSGDPDVSIACWRQAIERFRALGDPEEALIPVTNLAMALQEVGRLDEANAVLDSGLAVARRRDLPLLQAQLLVKRGELLLNQWNTADAAPFFEQALAVAPAAAADVAADIRLDQLRVIERSGRPGEALVFALRELPPLLPKVAPAAHADLEFNLAVVLDDAGRLHEGLEHARIAADVARTNELGWLAPSASAEQARALRGLGDRAGALAALREARGQWLARRSLARDPVRRERDGAAGALLALETADVLLDGRDGEPARMRAAFDALQPFKSRTLLERMSGPGGGAAHALPPAATLALVQSRVLREGEVLLDAFTSSGRSLLFVVTRRSCRVLRLPGARVLSERLAPYYRLLSSAPREGQDAAVRARTVEALSDLIAGDGAPELLAARHVIVSPDGPLHLLPFTELSLRSGATRVRLGQGREVTRVPSATLLANLRRRTPDAAPTARVLAWTGAADGAHSPLAGAEAEVRWLAGHVEHVEVRNGRTAKAMPPGAAFVPWDVLHFATHTRVRDQRPWDSGLLLADSAATGGQGWLTANHVANLRLRARLVVLAGCETARGGLVSGEGAQGLTSAFLVAGAPTVVSSLWRVDDAVTATFVMAFYRQLLRRHTVAAAVALAQAEVRAAAATSDPYYWAGFVVVGDGSARVPLQPRVRSGH